MIPLPSFSPAYDVAQAIRTGSREEADRARTAVTGAASAACHTQHGLLLGTLIAFLELVAAA